MLDDFQDQLLGGSAAAAAAAAAAPPAAPAAAPTAAAPAASGAQPALGAPAPAVKLEPQDVLASLAQLGVQLELQLCDSSDSDDEGGGGGEPLTDVQRLQKLIAGLAPPPSLKVEPGLGPGGPDLAAGPGPGPGQQLPPPAFDWRSGALLRPLHIKPEPGLLLPQQPGANPWLLPAPAPGPLYLPAGPYGATIKLEIVQGSSSDSSSSSGGRAHPLSPARCPLSPARCPLSPARPHARPLHAPVCALDPAQLCPAPQATTAAATTREWSTSRTSSPRRSARPC